MVFGIMTALAAVLVVQRLFYQWFWDRGLEAKLYFQGKRLWEGEQGELVEVVENRKFLPLAVLHVNVQVDRSFLFFDDAQTAVSDQAYRRDIFALLPWQRITRTLPFTASKRGYYQCKQVELVGRDLFFEGPYVKKQEQKEALYVYPRKISPEPVQAACSKMQGEFWNRYSLFEDPLSFSGIRDYEPKDSFRQINWKAFARAGSLKVNVYEHAAMIKGEILLNLKEETAWTEEVLLESVIRLGAAAAGQWINQGIPTSIYTNGPDVVTGEAVQVEEGAGAEHMETVLKALSRIGIKADRKWKEGQEEKADHCLWQCLARKRWRNSMILYLSVSCRREDVARLEALRQKGAVVLWILPYTMGQETNGEVPDPALAGYGGEVRYWRAEE